MKLCTPLFNERAMHMMAPIDDGRGGGGAHGRHGGSSSEEDDEEGAEEEAQLAGDKKVASKACCARNGPSCCPAPAVPASRKPAHGCGHGHHQKGEKAPSCFVSNVNLVGHAYKVVGVACSA